MSKNADSLKRFSQEMKKLIKRKQKYEYEDKTNEWHKVSD
jgi:hypothetical protein